MSSSSDPRAAAERLSFSTAREHVGAAGFAQRDALERLISAGREQIRFTQALREVIANTLAERHALPLADLHQAAEPHVTALESMVQSSQAQLETAESLRGAVQNALADVRGTPIEHFSAQLLTNLSQVVHQQAADLQGLVALALNEASTIQHITALQQMSVKAQAQFLRAERERSEHELVRLQHLGEFALDRIRVLEDGGVTHKAQKAHLEREGAASQAHITELEEGAARDDRELVRMEEQAQVLRACTASLEEAALQTQEKVARLRHQLEGQRANELGNQDHEPSTASPPENRADSRAH
ncbi:hypothetical protein [Deinococcus yavapaiensis]|uniref:Uncharacterized protein n=1 Tax=Deinococcus yavapaiensis KR-236 TaxID=694435 RepID=A0A318SKY4_9DEIO|nr:hypothetical protein [Deinococcus yavapaiensis]PYE55029.1 hypothetical protein DES52_104304 [Deinococcus yavapaiensis KR-236]